MFKLYLYNEKVYFQSLIKKEKKKKEKEKEKERKKERKSLFSTKENGTWHLCW